MKKSTHFSAVCIVDRNDGGSVEMMSSKEYERLIVEDFAPGLEVVYLNFQNRKEAERYAVLYDRLVKLQSGISLDFGEEDSGRANASTEIENLKVKMSQIISESKI